MFSLFWLDVTVCNTLYMYHSRGVCECRTSILASLFTTYIIRTFLIFVFLRIIRVAVLFELWPLFFSVNDCMHVSVYVLLWTVYRVRWSRLPWWNLKVRQNMMRACWSTLRTLSAPAASRSPSKPCPAALSY